MRIKVFEILLFDLVSERKMSKCVFAPVFAC